MYYLPPYNYYYRQPNYIKAYPTDIPVYVNGENINKIPYKALNYQPASANPAVYVPVAQFSRVGATVDWNEESQSIDVSTDVTLQYKLMSLKAWQMAYGEISKALETPAQYAMLRYNGLVDAKFVFDGVWWEPYSNVSAASLTVGKYYRGYADGAAGSIYLSITNDMGEESVFRRLAISISEEEIPW